MELKKEDHINLEPKGLADFYWFVSEILGHKKNEELGWSDLCKEHLELCKFLQFGAEKFKLILMPRFSLKSCICTIGYSLWRMVKDPNIRILIYSDSATKAQGFLGGIKSHITGESSDSMFSKLYGSLETDLRSGKWNESQITIKTRVHPEKEPTVDTGGIESTKVGCHYSLIIFDDIVSDLNTTTKAQMDKTYDCYKKSLSLLAPNGEVVMVGTRWAFGDTYGRIIAESENGESKDYGIMIKKAIVNDTYPFEAVGLNKTFLDGQRQRQGSYFFSVLYQNSPVDDSTAIFRHDDFKFYGKEKDLPLSDLFITCTCDPAGEGEDYTAFTVVGTDSNMRMYLLYASARHYQPSDLIEEIVKLSYAYKFVKFGIEVNFFGQMMDRELKMRLEQERKNPLFRSFGIEQFRASNMKNGKHPRILSLQPYHERGDLLFPGNSVESLKGSYSELAYQMMQYTHDHKPLHDDLIDSLSYHTQLIQKGSSAPEDKPAEDTIAYIMEQQREHLMKIERMKPRMYRRFYEPIFK
jgi:predicted phage terminase large subunit-like protein